MRCLAIGIVLLGACGAKTPAPAPVHEAPEAPPPSKAGIAVVFETQFVWLGDDTWWQGDVHTRYTGYYHPLEAAIDALAAHAPPDAQVALIAYGFRARVMWQGTVADLTGDKIGAQVDLTSSVRDDGKRMQEVGVAANAGVGLARDTLASMPVGTRHLLLIGDGNGADGLAAERHAFAAAGWDASAVYLPSSMPDLLPGDEKGWDGLTDEIWDVDSGDDLADTVGEIAARWR